PALERNAKFGAQAIEVSPASPRHQDTACIQRARNAALNDRFGHQCRDLDPDINHRPSEARIFHADEDLLQPRLGQMAGEEGDMLGHGSSCSRRESASLSSARLSTTTTSLNDFSRAVFSRSIWRG